MLSAGAVLSVVPYGLIFSEDQHILCHYILDSRGILLVTYYAQKTRSISLARTPVLENIVDVITMPRYD
jgi:hypothetical protein